MIRVIMHGCNGKMGQVIASILSEDEQAKVSFGFDINTERKNSFPVYNKIENIKEKADVVIDFSHPASLPAIISYCKTNSVPAVIATTGHSIISYFFTSRIVYIYSFNTKSIGKVR